MPTPQPRVPFTGSPTQEETPIQASAHASHPLIDDSPTQEEVTQSTPYKRRPRTDLATKRMSPLKPRPQSPAEESDSDAEFHGPLPALRLAASQSDSEADDEADNNLPGGFSRPAPAPIGNAPSFLYTGSGHRSRHSSQKSKNSSRGRQSQSESSRPAPSTDTDTQDSFFNSPTFLNGELTHDSGSFVGSMESDIAEYVPMDVDPPSFDLHTQDLLPVKSVLDKRRDA